MKCSEVFGILFSWIIVEALDPVAPSGTAVSNTGLFLAYLINHYTGSLSVMPHNYFSAYSFISIFSCQLPLYPLSLPFYMVHSDLYTSGPALFCKCQPHISSDLFGLSYPAGFAISGIRLHSLDKCLLSTDCLLGTKLTMWDTIFV